MFALTQRFSEALKNNLTAIIVDVDGNLEMLYEHAMDAADRPHFPYGLFSHF